MHRILRHLLHMLFLALFSIYAFSPNYLVNADPIRAGRGDDLRARGGVEVGILSVKMVLSSFIDGAEEGRSGDSSISADSRDDELLIIMKKRCVLPECHDVRPLPQTATLSLDRSLGETPRWSANAVPAPRHHAPDGYYHCTTGLDPPLFLS